MKKLLSISFALLILLSGMHFTIATHFCEGELSASKVSFSGELASCGMEGSVDQCFSSCKHSDSDCCKNEVSVLAVDHNFAPTFTLFKIFSPNLLQVFEIPTCIQIHSLTAANLTCTTFSPPGNFLANAVSLPKICVFRI
jgi:hypothetical protein